MVKILWIIKKQLRDAETDSFYGFEKEIFEIFMRQWDYERDQTEHAKLFRTLVIAMFATIDDKQFYDFFMSKRASGEISFYDSKTTKKT